MAEDEELNEEDLPSEENAGTEDAEALEEAMAGGDGTGDETDALSEEMLNMMEDEDKPVVSNASDDVDQAMETQMLKAMEESGSAPGQDAPIDNPGFGGGVPPNIERLMDVPLTVTIELGRTRKTIETVMEYGDQSLIELDKNVGEPCDVLVNGELFARGEVVTVSENFGVRITELVNPSLRQ